MVCKLPPTPVSGPLPMGIQAVSQPFAPQTFIENFLLYIHSKTTQNESSPPRVRLLISGYPARNLEINLDCPLGLFFPLVTIPLFKYLLNPPTSPPVCFPHPPSPWVHSLPFSQSQLLNCKLTISFPCLIPLRPSFERVWTLQLGFQSHHLRSA